MKINPILEKELKIKSRTWKTPTLMMIYLFFISIIPCGYLLISWFQSQNSLATMDPRGMVEIFSVVSAVQLVLILFILPPMACGTISGEKSRQTFDLLLCTRMSCFSIIKGKIQNILLHIILLIVASFPILSLTYVYGGVKFTELALLLFFYLTTALMVTSLGVFFSSIFKKTVVAIIVTYLFIIFINIFTALGLGLYVPLINQFFKHSFEPSYMEISLFLFSNTSFGFISIFDGDGNFFWRGINNLYKDHSIKPWMLTISFNLIFSAILITLSTLKINPIRGYGKGK